MPDDRRPAYPPAGENGYGQQGATPASSYNGPPVHRSEPTVRRSDPRYGRESGSSRPSSSGRDYPAGGNGSNGNSGYPAGSGQPSGSQPNGRGQAPGNGPSVPYARKAASGSGRHSSPQERRVKR